MAFDDLLIHRLHTYDPNMDTARDEYNNPIVKLNPTSNKTGLKCRVSQQITKKQGFTQSEVELIEEVPVSLFVTPSWTPANNNYVLGISVTGDTTGMTAIGNHTPYSDEEFFLIKTIDVKYNKTSVHHYELIVVPSTLFSRTDILAS